MFTNDFNKWLDSSAAVTALKIWTARLRLVPAFQCVDCLVEITKEFSSVSFLDRTQTFMSCGIRFLERFLTNFRGLINLKLDNFVIALKHYIR